MEAYYQNPRFKTLSDEIEGYFQDTLFFVQVLLSACAYHH